MWKGAGITLAYVVVFVAVAALHFRRKDILS
jgi:ABC-type transport system involved in multi-copper enzyme maturation permease subunit